MSPCLRWCRENPDRFVAWAGVYLVPILTVFLYYRGFPPVYFVAVGLLCVACVAYLATRWRIPVIRRLQPQTVSFLDGLFVLVFIASIVVYVVRPDTYVRPLPYFGLTALAAGILAVKIWALPKGARHTAVTLVQIMAVGASAIYTVCLLYPSLIGMDTYWHQRQTLRILDGHLDYHSLPTMYLIVAGFMKVADCSYRVAVMATIVPIYVVGDTLLVYLLGKMTVGRRVGLLSSLLVGVAGWHVFFGFWTIPNTLAMTLALGVLSLVLWWWRYGMRLRVLIPSVIVLVVALVFTHAIAAMWVMIALCLFCVVLALRRRSVGRVVVLTVGVLAVVVVLWLPIGYVGHLGNLLVYEFNPQHLGFTVAPGMNENRVVEKPVVEEEMTDVGVVTGELPQEPSVIEPSVSLYDKPKSIEMISGASLGETLFNCSGMFLFFAVSLVGTFWMLRRGRRSYSWFLAILGLLVLGLGFIPMILGASLLEHRWWLFAEVLLSIPLAIALMVICGRRGRLGLYAMLVVVGLLSFLNLVGLPTNMDNDSFSKNQLVKYGFTEAELEVLGELSNRYEMVGVDELYTLACHTPGLVENSYGRVWNITPRLLDGTVADCDVDVLLIRKEVVDRPIGAGYGSIYRLTYDPRVVLADTGWRLVYDCGTVQAFDLTK